MTGMQVLRMHTQHTAHNTFTHYHWCCLVTFFSLSIFQLQEATEMSCKEGAGSLKKNLKTFALQNFGMIFGLMLMFVLALYSTSISV